MKVKDVVAELQKFDQELDTVYSIDDEGNGYSYVHYAPSEGKYEDGEFASLSDIEKDGEEYGFGPDSERVVCLN